MANERGKGVWRDTRKSAKWIIDFVVAGERIARSSGTDDKVEAERMAAEIRAKRKALQSPHKRAKAASAASVIINAPSANATVTERGRDVWRDTRRSAIWQIDFTFGGMRHTASTRTSDKAEAERIAAEYYHEVSGMSQPDDSREVTFGRAVLDYVKSVGATTRRAAEEGKHFKRLIEWIGHDLPMSKLDGATIVEVRTTRAQMPNSKRRGAPVANATVNRETVDLLKRVWRHCYLKNKAVVPIDWAKYRLEEAEPPKRQISISAELDMLASKRFRDGYGAAFEFGLISGLRVHNLVNLRWSQVDLVERRITVGVKSKRGAPKTITQHLDEEMFNLLKAQRGRHPEFVFAYTAARTRVNPKSGKAHEAGKMYPLTTAGFTSWFRRNPELRGYMVHDLRRTAGARIVSATHSLLAAQNLLGHSDISITAKHYAHLLAAEQVEAQTRARERTARLKTQTLADREDR